MDILSKMLAALVITLREGIEAALVVAIVLAYLKKTERAQLSRFVYLGLSLAVLASLLGAAILYLYGLDVENEVIEGVTMLVAAGLVSSMVVWMWLSGRQIKKQVEQKVGRLAAGGGLGLLLFIFFMVLREGVETVLFLAGLSMAVASNPMFNFLGGALGLVLAALFGVLLVKGSLRINLKLFFSTTGIVLLLLALKLFAGALHEFAEVALIPTTRSFMAVIGFLTRESTSVFILMALILVPGLALLWQAIKKEPVPLGSEATAAERRKALAQARRAKGWACSAFAGSLALTLLLATSLVAAARKGYDPDPNKIAPQGEELRIPVAELEEGRMHKYQLDMDGKTVRFFLIKGKTGRIASAFDVCGICPLKGYRQDGEQVMCKSCDAPINLASIGDPGGCNPIPLKSEVRGEVVVVKVKDLAAEAAKF